MPDELISLWRIQFSRQAQKTLRRLDRVLRTRLDKAIQELAHNPFPTNSRKLVGAENDYRLRIGNWRVIYTLYEQQVVILVVKIAPRGQVYKK